MLLVDTANVVGSRPDGWWRDRAGATGRLIQQVSAAVAAGRASGPAVMVLEGAGRRAAPTGRSDHVEIVHATGEGDDTLVDLARTACRAGGAEPVTVVTADRVLGERLRAVGAVAVGPRWLLDRLETIETLETPLRPDLPPGVGQHR
ncbi:MAG: hypothetical protein M3Y91_10900 [Actinomycetota bacterium]|nr:hypothetical protein [Actinomycetota bacterium]